MPGASIKMAIAAAVVRSAVTQHCNNAWLTGSGVAPVRPVHTRRRQNHVCQPGSGGAERSVSLGKKLRQLGDVRRDPPRLILRQQLRLLKSAIQVPFMQLPILVPRCLSETKEEQSCEP